MGKAFTSLPRLAGLSSEKHRSRDNIRPTTSSQKMLLNITGDDDASGRSVGKQAPLRIRQTPLCRRCCPAYRHHLAFQAISPLVEDIALMKCTFSCTVRGARPAGSCV